MEYATMCYLRRDGETLLLYRNKGARDMHNGMYVPPGGKTHRGERGIDCIVREFKEETGLTLVRPELRIIATFYNKGRVMGGRENPEDWHVKVYQARRFRGRVAGEHPGAEPRWIKDGDLADISMYPGDRKLIELLGEQGLFEVLLQYDKEALVRFEVQRV